jgi:hypothetical protein
VLWRLLDCFASYFGALACVAWSPDGRFIIVRLFIYFRTIFSISGSIFQTGGQDDLLTIFSPGEQRVVARCQGHSSFVGAVAFDYLRCDGRTYRFGSVGEDNKLILVHTRACLCRRLLLTGVHSGISQAEHSIAPSYR